MQYPGPPASGAPLPPRSRRPGAALLRFLFAFLLGTTLGGACVMCGGGIHGDEVIVAGRERVGVVEVVGPIMSSEESVRNIREFGRRDDLKAIVIRIDSPGGAVAPSQEIYAAMRDASARKPVVASMGTVAASGGFWAALGADRIFASAGSVTGSIGVVSQTPDLRGLAELLRVNVRTFKSGPLKDAGNPFREMTPADEALFMELIHDIYGQFISLVSERRHLDLEVVRALADGRIMTGRAALEAGLIDELGGLHDAAKNAVILAEAREAAAKGITDTATRSGIEEEEEPTLVYPKKSGSGFLRLLLEGTESAMARGIADGLARMGSEVREEAGRTTTSVELR